MNYYGFLAALWLLVSIFFSSRLLATNFNNETLKDDIFAEEVLYAKVYTEHNQNTYPILSLTQSNFITLEFDINATNRIDYYFQFIPCRSNWTAFNGNIDYFIANYNQFNILNVENSNLPANNYIHYSAFISNYNIGFLKSGNYLLQVFETIDNKTPIFQKRIYVVREMVKMNLNKGIHLNNAEKQIIDVSISSLPVNISYFVSNLKLILLQNNMYDRSIHLEKPTKISADSIVYSNPNLQSFWSGNPWYIADLSSTTLQDKTSEYTYSVPTITLQTIRQSNHLSEPNHFNHIYNGLFTLTSFEGVDINTQGKYYYVRFGLENTKGLFSKKQENNIFIVGDFTNYQIVDKYRFKYNDYTKRYECVLLLKQGVYSYNYMIPTTDEYQFVFNNNKNTQNQYIAFCYDTKDYNSEEIIGYKVWTYFF